MEFSYPPLMPDEGHDSNLLPEEWKYLPFLALPDGAHNYQEGTSPPHTLASWSILDKTEKNRHLKNSRAVDPHFPPV